MSVTSIETLPQLKKIIEEGSLGVMVHFSATGSEPCIQLSSTINQLSATKRTIAFYKVNVDDVTGSRDEFGVREIPTVMLFKGGSKIGNVAGANANVTGLTTLIQKLVR